MGISVRRIYDEPERKEGMRILVDRLWPRGVSKAKARIDAWMKELAPSDGLRRWYQHDPDKWPEFKERYFAELDANPEAVEELLAEAESKKVVLLFGTKELHYNNAVALKEYIESALDSQGRHAQP